MEGLDAYNATWEDHLDLQEAYRNLNFKDKVDINGGGILTKAT